MNRLGKCGRHRTTLDCLAKIANLLHAVVAVFRDSLANQFSKKKLFYCSMRRILVKCFVHITTGR